MHRYDGRVKALAALLAGLAGYVDAMGFIALGGFFVSFMSGNSTRLAVGLAEGSSAAILAAALVALFVTGVVAGATVGRLAGRHRAPMVLGLVAVWLAAAAVLGRMAGPGASAAAMALAMGAENAVFNRDGETPFGLTYMTGTLVKLGQRLAAAFAGGPPWAWAPYLLLWAGLVSGAVLGALAHAAFGLQGLWLAAAVAAVAAGVAARLQV